MKQVLLIGLLSLGLIACQKEQTEPKEDLLAKQQFEQADQKIGVYLDILDNQNTSKQQSTKIICEDYPRTYKADYLPKLIKLSPEYTEQKLLKHLDEALDYYKNKLDIECAK
ncbi:hypothetical protein [Acinetobacter sp. TGL-Y2]|uniref:hypothetical protein n=1 Tax=Acinetobacter sp. TGL-Y2 TaxID=1407071 RepID=UPI000A65827C|nr:hypothetical protein [Acinetobacter sp. TGL-Y2]